MDTFKQIEAFVAVATKGGLSAAAQDEGVTPAIMGRRLDALESRLGVKLLLRTTRKVSLTSEGTAFLEDCQRVLTELANAEASVTAGVVKARGHLKISAPAGFGRRHVAPLVARFMAENPELSIHLDLTDRIVDLINEGVDCAVRVGELEDSSLVRVTLAQNRRVVVASPAYLAAHGTPQTLDDLDQHTCLCLPLQRGWTLRVGEQSSNVKVGGRLACNDGAVLHEWALAGMGLAWRSMWEIEADLREGRLVTVLDHLAADPNGIYAVFPQGRVLPLRVRLFVDFLKGNYGNPDYWRSGGE